MPLVSMILAFALSLPENRPVQVPLTPPGVLPIQAETIPAEFRRGVVIVPCAVGGVPSLRCMLDAGSSTTALTPALFRQLNMNPTGKSGASGLNARADTLPTTKVQIGNNVFSVERSIAAPLAGISTAVGEKIDVILGTSIFEQMQITTDPLKSEVRFAASGTSVGSGALPLQASVANYPPPGFVRRKTENRDWILVPFHVGRRAWPALSPGEPYFHAWLHRATSRQFGAYFGAPNLNHSVVTYDLGRSKMYVTPTLDIAKAFEP